MNKIDKLIVNSPYEEPQKYWEHIRDTREFILKENARRPAGYVVASESSKAFDDPGIFIEIQLVNTIRPRIKKWREQGYPGVTGITKRLLAHWQEPEERKDRRFFFCQLEVTPDVNRGYENIFMLPCLKGLYVTVTIIMFCSLVESASRTKL